LPWGPLIFALETPLVDGSWLRSWLQIQKILDKADDNPASTLLTDTVFRGLMDLLPPLVEVTDDDLDLIPPRLVCLPLPPSGVRLGMIDCASSEPSIQEKPSARSTRSSGRPTSRRTGAP